MKKSLNITVCFFCKQNNTIYFSIQYSNLRRNTCQNSDVVKIFMKISHSRSHKIVIYIEILHRLRFVTGSRNDKTARGSHNRRLKNKFYKLLILFIFAIVQFREDFRRMSSWEVVLCVPCTGTHKEESIVILTSRTVHWARQRLTYLEDSWKYLWKYTYYIHVFLHVHTWLPKIPFTVFGIVFVHVAIYYWKSYCGTGLSEIS